MSARCASTRSLGSQISCLAALDRLDPQIDETKAAIKSTEFCAYLVTFAGILIAAQVISDGDSGTGASGDVFNANRAWLYLTILTVGYMVSRGLAKAGSGHPDHEDTRRGSD